MPRLLIRIVLGAAGALALLLALRLWLDPAVPAGNLGLAGQGALGRATLRADVGGFFAAAGGFCLAAVIRNDRRLLFPPLILIALALGGRLVSALHDGLAGPPLPPLVIEAVLVVLLLLGRRLLPARS